MDEFLQLWEEAAHDTSHVEHDAIPAVPDGPVWEGDDLLRTYLVPIADLYVPLGSVAGDVDAIAGALEGYGQVRPVLVADDEREVVGRAHIVEAALQLGWTHVAVRLRISEEAAESREQLSFVEEVEANGGGDVAMIQALTRPPGWAEADEVEIDGINEASSDPDAEWVGLPEFVRGGDPVKLVVSCSTEQERDAILDALGISTIHKGTRGTLSVWWPERPKKDLASLRFVSGSTS